MGDYDPFSGGPFSAGVRTIEALDSKRNRQFPCEIWYPESGRGPLPLILFSHASMQNRRSASNLFTHLSSHGYVVAAMDHSELVAPELGRNPDATPEERAARIASVIGGRVPDIGFLADHLLRGAMLEYELHLDPTRIGLVGHSFGGWTVLAAPDIMPGIRAVVALAPGGASKIRPGILPLQLDFDWGRDVPTLYLVAEDDVSLPLEGMYELFERTPGTKQMVVLRRADHLHFIDDAERQHETVRTMEWPAELSWMKEMRPISELCSGEQAHQFVSGLTLCHMDAVLRQDEGARRFLAGNIEAALALRGIEAFVPSQLGEQPPPGRAFARRVE